MLKAESLKENELRDKRKAMQPQICAVIVGELFETVAGNFLYTKPENMPQGELYPDIIDWKQNITVEVKTCHHHDAFKVCISQMENYSRVVDAQKSFAFFPSRCWYIFFAHKVDRMKGEFFDARDLEKVLAEKTKYCIILEFEIIEALYLKAKKEGNIKDYANWNSGPFFKITQADLRELINDRERVLIQLGLDPGGYIFFEDYKKKVVLADLYNKLRFSFPLIKIIKK